MASIYTLETDIRELLKTKNWLTPSLQKELSEGVGNRIKAQFEEQKKPSLRLSKMGDTCPKALWHSIHTPELAEDLPPWAHNKFSVGHFWEAYLLVQCKAAGHRVEGEQDELQLNGVQGHRDAVIDGCVVDIKSASTRQFAKFRNRTLEKDDPFGYLDQLDGYIVASLHDPLVLVKDRGYFLAIDKQMGHPCVYEHIARTDHVINRVSTYKRIVGQSDPPDCTCETTPIGAGGNIKLGVRASYSAFKWTCFPQLRCFLYAEGPVYFSHVATIPRNTYGNIREINKDGYIIHNY